MNNSDTRPPAAEIHPLIKSPQLQPKRPDYLKRLAGGVIIFLGFIGCVVTSPLLILGGAIGFFTGLVRHKALLRSGLQGAKIGSLGSISAVLYGIELMSATVESVEPTLKDLDAQENKTEYQQLDLDEPFEEVSDNTETPEETTSAKTYKSTQPIDFNNPEKVKAFIARITKLAISQEKKAVPKETDRISRIRNNEIQALTATLKIIATEHDFWCQLDKMTDKEITFFVRGLSFVKEKGRFSSSDLDYLWRHFTGFDFQPHLSDRKKRYFQVMLEALSYEQINASFSSADFLKIFHNEAFIGTLANALNSQQLALVASDFARQKTLNVIIRKLKPDEYLLGKLVAILPFATSEVKFDLIEQLAHSPHDASFNIELTRLADYYVAINDPAYTLYLSKSVKTTSLGRQSTTWTPNQFKPAVEALPIDSANEAMALH